MSLPWQRRFSLLALLALAVCLLGAEGEPEASKTKRIPYGNPRELCKLENKQINESSGLACSWRRKDVLWTNNDSGDRPRLFAFDMKGRDLGDLQIDGAKARDWEDMASVRIGRKSYLVCADVGDNGARRETCTIYLVPEPPVGPKGMPPDAKMRVALTLEFRYEDGPRDCEGVAVDPKGRTIFLVGKQKGVRCKVYALPIPKAQPKKVLEAKAIATLSVPTITALDVSCDGLRAMLLTYAGAYEYVREPDEKWADAFARKPRAVGMPLRRQGESICYGQDGKTLYLTSEGIPTPLWLVPVKEEESSEL